MTRKFKGALVMEDTLQRPATTYGLRPSVVNHFHFHPLSNQNAFFIQPHRRRRSTSQLDRLCCVRGMWSRSVIVQLLY